MADDQGRRARSAGADHRLHPRTPGAGASPAPNRASTISPAAATSAALPPRFSTGPAQRSVGRHGRDPRRSARKAGPGPPPEPASRRPVRRPAPRHSRRRHWRRDRTSPARAPRGPARAWISMATAATGPQHQLEARERFPRRWRPCRPPRTCSTVQDLAAGHGDSDKLDCGRIWRRRGPCPARRPCRTISQAPAVNLAQPADPWTSSAFCCDKCIRQSRPPPREALRRQEIPCPDPRIRPKCCRLCRVGARAASEIRRSKRPIVVGHTR